MRQVGLKIHKRPCLRPAGFPCFIPQPVTRKHWHALLEGLSTPSGQLTQAQVMQPHGVLSICRQSDICSPALGSKTCVIGCPTSRISCQLQAGRNCFKQYFFAVPPSSGELARSQWNSPTNLATKAWVTILPGRCTFRSAVDMWTCELHERVKLCIHKRCSRELGDCERRESLAAVNVKCFGASQPP